MLMSYRAATCTGKGSIPVREDHFVRKTLGFVVGTHGPSNQLQVNRCGGTSRGSPAFNSSAIRAGAEIGNFDAYTFITFWTNRSCQKLKLARHAKDRQTATLPLPSACMLVEPEQAHDRAADLTSRTGLSYRTLEWQELCGRYDKEHSHPRHKTTLLGFWG